MNYHPLMHELERDPLGVGYAKMSDEQVAKALSERNKRILYEKKKPFRQALGDLPITDLIVLKDELERLVLAPRVRVAAAMLEHLNAHLSNEKNPFVVSEEPDLGDPDVLAVIEALPYFDPVAKHTLRSLAESRDPTVPAILGEKMISRADELGLGEVTVEEVAKIKRDIQVRV